CAAVSLHRRMAVLVRRWNGVDLRYRPVDGDTGADAADRLEEVQVVPLPECGRQLRPEWHPDVDRAARKCECLRHHGNDFVVLIVQADAAADGVRIGAKVALPQAITDDRDTRRAEAILVCGEWPAGERRH